MNPLFIQLLIIAFVVFAAANVVRRVVRGELRRNVAAAWLLLWLTIAAAVVAPQTTQALAGWLGVGRGVDVVIYLAIVALFYLQFRTLLRLEKMEQVITAAVRAAALKEFENEKGKGAGE